MENPIAHGFRNLIRFSGCDTRRQFWPYAALLIAGYMTLGPIILGLVVVPSMIASFSRPEALAAMFGPFMIVNTILFLTVVACFAAAVARRLRDGGASPFWGLLPLPFVAFSLTAFGYIIATGMIEGLFPFVAISNLLYLASLVTLIVLLARPSRPVPESAP